MKYLRYYGLLLLYYLIAFYVILITFEPIDGSIDIGGINVFVALFTIGSPLLLVKPLINRFYPNDNKVKHAKRAGYIVLNLMILHVIGASTSNYLNQSSIPFYVFHLALVFTLISYREVMIVNVSS